MNELLQQLRSHAPRGVEEITVWFAVGYDGHFRDPDTLNAYLGFMAMSDGLRMHVKPEFFESGRLACFGLPDGMGPGDVLVGSVNDVRGALRNLGCPLPVWNDYPEPLRDWLPALPDESTLGEMLGRVTNPRVPPVFIKPRGATKRFTGMVLSGADDAMALVHLPEELPVWTMPVVDYVSEWRVFVLDGEMVAMKPYTGDAFIPPDRQSVMVALDRVKEWPERPAFFCLDFGIAQQGDTHRTYLVEANDGYALGSYDMDSFTYARGLLARWRELTAPNGT